MPFMGWVWNLMLHIDNVKSYGVVATMNFKLFMLRMDTVVLQKGTM
jgi:hypothetical protein